MRGLSGVWKTQVSIDDDEIDVWLVIDDTDQTFHIAGARRRDTGDFVELTHEQKQQAIGYVKL